MFAHVDCGCVDRVPCCALCIMSVYWLLDAHSLPDDEFTLSAEILASSIFFILSSSGSSEFSGDPTDPKLMFLLGFAVTGGDGLTILSPEVTVVVDLSDIPGVAFCFPCSSIICLNFCTTKSSRLFLIESASETPCFTSSTSSTLSKSISRSVPVSFDIDGCGDLSHCLSYLFDFLDFFFPSFFVGDFETDLDLLLDLLLEWEHEQVLLIDFFVTLLTT